MLRVILIGVAIFLTLAIAGVGGTYFALKRPDIPFETLEAKYRAPDSQYLDLGDGVVVHYRDVGLDAAGTVLLIHGYGASSATWDGWAEVLKPRFRVVRLDLPGHGLTRSPADYEPSPDAYADLVQEFARRLGLGPVAVAGNSMGGNVAWRLAERHPERVAALVLVDAAGFIDEGARAAPLFELIRSPFWGPILMDLDSTSLARQTLLASFHDQTRVTDDMVTRYVELSRAPGRRALLRRLTLASFEADPATPERLARLTAPTLVLHGAQDALIPLQHGERFAGAIPGAQLVVFDAVGHLPQEEIPEASARVVERFLMEAPPHSPLGQPLELRVAPDGPGAPLPVDAGRDAKPLEGVY